MTFLIAMIWLFSGSGRILADESVSINGDGYIKSDLYWYKPGSTVSYNRSAYKSYYWVEGTPGYYYTSNCCRYWYAGTPGYYQAYTAYNYYPVQISADAADLESQIVALAKDQQTVVLRIAERQKKVEGAMALSDRLGVSRKSIANFGDGMFPLSGYSYSSSYGTQLTGLQGNTVSGYSSNFQVLSLEAKGIDYAPLVQLWLQGVNNNSSNAAQVQAGAGTVLSSGLADLSRERQLLFKSAAAANLATAAGRAVEPPGSIKITQANGNSTPTAPAAPPTPNPPSEQLPQPKPPVSDEARNNFLNLSGPTQCIRCHGAGKSAQKSFDITLYNPATASDEDIDRVWAYVTSTDPKASCGKASKRSDLSPKEQRQFLRP